VTRSDDISIKDIRINNNTYNENTGTVGSFSRRQEMKETSTNAAVTPTGDPTADNSQVDSQPRDSITVDQGMLIDDYSKLEQFVNPSGQ